MNGATADLVHALNQSLGAIGHYAEACRMLLGRPGHEARIAAALAAIVEQSLHAGSLLNGLHAPARDDDDAVEPGDDARSETAALAAALAALGYAPPAGTAGCWPGRVAAAGLIAELPALAARLAAVAAQPCIVTATPAADGGRTLTLASGTAMRAPLPAQYALLDAATSACAARLHRCGISLSPRFLPGHGLTFEFRLPVAG